MAQGDEVGQLWEQLRQKDAQILMLQKKLQHFRTWLGSVNTRVQQMNPSAVRNARKLYIGGIPSDATDEELRHFFNNLMLRSGALTSPGSSILSCRINHDKSYAFIEFRSVEEASNAMALDGIRFKEVYLKIRRPSNYDINTAMMLGPVASDPTMDTSGLDMCRAVVEDSPSKLFIGGLQCDWSEEEVKGLLAPYGSLKSFNLVMDKVTGKSKGYAFCEFVEESVTDYVVKSLHNKKQGSKVLTVKRALEGALARQQQQQAVQAVAAAQQHHVQAAAAVAQQGVVPQPQPQAQQGQQQQQVQPPPPANAQPPSPMGSIEQQQPSPIGAHATPQPARPTGAVPGQYTGSTQPASISPSSLASSMQTSPAHSNSSPAGAAVPGTPGMTHFYPSPATPAAPGAFPPQGNPTQAAAAAAAAAAQAAAYSAGTPTSAAAAAAAAGTPQAAMFQQQPSQPQQPSQQPPTSQAYAAGPAGYYPQGQAQPLSGATTPGGTSTGGYNSGNSSAVSSNRSSGTGTGGPYPQGVPVTGPQAKAAAAAMQNAAINGYGNSVMGNLW